MKEILILNPENATEEEVKNYSRRDAARGVVVDDQNKLALLHVSKGKYYKLPGGGLEGDEDKFTAFRRECAEEIGSDVEISVELGIVVEYRKIFQLKQTSYCYLAKVKSEKGTPDFTDEEKANGFEVAWVSYADALQLLNESRDTAANLEGREYIVPRDIAILKAAEPRLPLVM
ncbi:hypothetical protein A2765_03915 [Candidatus Kaiserbacteria bacterium RIFCSPHIGHO2_01_FULL_56_24]|uniref:Nudix hydrolase domain-containing protein n=1 Tax=Candidatus Kaiserbacteria bacterium RIFCSPHIGHO2_01_FULL_56_24 TaxID=1798487 RepID=A0A1F6DE56_9BACT|nr:MAG: hypothetical protein A2765_03915 [Candidatus Kaiserbacteria bacterium RIFCSPHIGHO2_01_FULL_56_24]